MVLGIYGAGGLGREISIIAKKVNGAELRWEEIVFIDDIGKVQGENIFTLENLIERYSVGLEIIIGVGEPAVREAMYNKVKQHKIPLITLIHPGVYIDETVSLGEGVVICEGVTITSNIFIGENSYIHPHAAIGHDVTIGKHSVIGTNCQIGGANTIGDRTYMGFLSGTKEGLNVGNDVICSAGAIVFRNMPDGVIAVGNPARIMKKNEGKRVFQEGV